jgi:hypothetical protein
VNSVIAKQRLYNQHITRQGFRQPSEVVAWFGGVQAQEYLPAKWALALRMPAGTTESQIEQAFTEGKILRTHVMRPTWHFVTPADIRWMLKLTAPCVHRRMAPYDRQLGLDPTTKRRAATIMERALRDGQFLTRAELGIELKRAGMATNHITLAHLALYAELEGIMCSGPRRGKQFTYALLANRAPRASRLSRDQALAELTRRFFRSHGPATHSDFAWWSGLTAADAKRGLDMIGARQRLIDGRSYWTVGRTPTRAGGRILHLLPIYDEYLVAYRDRQAVPHAASMVKSDSGGYVGFQHALVIAGQIAGTWKTVRKANEIIAQVVPLRRLTRPERTALTEATTCYGRFLGGPVHLSIA